VLRGGRWSSFTDLVRSSLRRDSAPVNSFDYIGFRVARDPL